jgi:hypothetical protein
MLCLNIEVCYIVVAIKFVIGTDPLVGWMGLEPPIKNQRAKGIGWNFVPPSVTAASCLYGEKQPLAWCLQDMH